MTRRPYNHFVSTNDMFTISRALQFQPIETLIGGLGWP
jgi:hypothetical protein